MVDILLQIGAAKLVVSAALAGLAWVVQRRVGHPAVVHPLWLMVLVAMLLPAVVAIPVLPGKSGAFPEIAGNAGVADEMAVRIEVGAASGGDSGAGRPLLSGISKNGKAGLAAAWIVVAAVLLGWTLVRAWRFRRWLEGSSGPAPPELRCEVVELGRGLGLARLPEMRTTNTHVSPMVYWAGGRVRLVIPSFLLDGLKRQELRAVLAHELAHVRRRDHLVRWIEWLACAAFWWNPVAWWARRELRAAEEASCDALGMMAAKCTPRAYATSLVHVVELLFRPSPSPTPAFATGIASGRNRKALERRLRMVISGKLTDQAPRWARSVGLAAAAVLLPTGLVYCGFADASEPTALEEPLDVTSPVQSDAPATQWQLQLVDSIGPEAEVVYRFLGWNDDDGLLAPVDQPQLPAECRTAPGGHAMATASLSTKFCASALADRYRRHGGVAGACVSALNKDGSWRGDCEFWVPRTPPDAPELTAGEVFRSMTMAIGHLPVPTED